MLAYLGRYTHRVATANSRLVSLDDDAVAFRWRDYRHGNAVRVMTLRPAEFIRRFLLHALPDGFHRIRYCRPASPWEHSRNGQQGITNKGHLPFKAFQVVSPSHPE